MGDVRTTVLVVSVVIIVVLGRGTLKAIRTLPWDILIVRFLATAHHDGSHKTNATWFYPATRENTRQYSHVSEWVHLPKFPRLLWRLASFAWLIFAIGESFVNADAMEATMIGFLVFVFTCVGFTLEHRWRISHHEADVLEPLLNGISQQLNVSYATARRLLDLPPGALDVDNGQVGTLMLPQDFVPSEGQMVSVGNLLAGHISREVEIVWQVDRPPRQAVIMVAGKPPTRVLLSEVDEYIAEAPVGSIYLGQDRFNEPHYASLNDGGEDPHWGVSARSGRGKSVFLGMTAIQILAQDDEAQVVCIDPKGVSLAHLDGIPGFVYFHDHTNVVEMWEGIAGVRRELEARIDARKRDKTITFPKLVLMVDELSRFADMTKDAWREYSGRGFAPVWTDFRSILQQGREFDVHLIGVSQRFDDRSTGIQGTKSYFGFKALAGYGPNEWNLLVGAGPMPEAQDGVGRWIYVTDETQTWVQNVAPDGESKSERDSNMRKWADEHIPARQWDNANNGEDQEISPEGHQGTHDHQSPFGSNHRPRYLTGIDAGAAYCGMKPETFKQARLRRPVRGEKRVGRQLQWTPNQLDKWMASRPRAGRTMRERALT